MDYKKINRVLLPLIALELITFYALLKVDLGHFPLSGDVVENYQIQLWLSAARISCGVCLFSLVTLAFLMARRGRAIGD